MSQRTLVCSRREGRDGHSARPDNRWVPLRCRAVRINGSSTSGLLLSLHALSKSIWGALQRNRESSRIGVSIHQRYAQVLSRNRNREARLLRRVRLADAI